VTEIIKLLNHLRWKESVEVIWFKTPLKEWLSS